MARKQAKRLLVVSSESGMEVSGGPPELGRAGSGPLGAVRAVHERGEWPGGLDLLVVSDIFGLVDLLNPEEVAVPIPFSRPENPGWWADFVGHNLDRIVKSRGYASALVLPNPQHEQALRNCGKLNEIDTVWGNKGVAGLAGAELLQAWLSGKTKQRASTPSKRATSTAAKAQAAEVARPAVIEESPVIEMPPLVADKYLRIVEDSIYSDRFMIIVSRLGRDEGRAVQTALRAEWGQRRSKGRARKSVSNVVIKAARLPWSYRPAATLGGRLLESIGMSTLLGSINKAVSQLAITEPGRYREILARIPEDESEFMTDFLYLLWEASSRMDKDEIGLLRAYLLDECTPGELRRLGLPRNLGLEDRYEVLHTAIKCFIGLAPVGVLGDYRRVWVWFDEIENLLAYKEEERWETVKALQTMFGDRPPCLSVWMNISPDSEATTEEIQAALENMLVLNEDLA
ncbi:MAG TPA: hypothetical protein VLQ48_14355 [Chloroflexia bacterium]|nr:hypothetical protein [Chloroflexia bacterium]